MQISDKQLVQRPSRELLYRVLAFLITYLTAMLATLVVMALVTAPVFALMLLMFAPITILFFPGGLITSFERIFHQTLGGDPYYIFVVLGYLGIGLAGSFIKNKWVFRILYAIFVILLIMNIVGCSLSTTFEPRNIW